MFWNSQSQKQQSERGDISFSDCNAMELILDTFSKLDVVPKVKQNSTYKQLAELWSTWLQWKSIESRRTTAKLGKTHNKKKQQVNAVLKTMCQEVFGVSQYKMKKI